MPSSSITKPQGIKKLQTRNQTAPKTQRRIVSIKNEPTLDSMSSSQSAPSPVIELHPWVNYLSSSAGDWIHYEPDQDFQRYYNPHQQISQFSQCASVPTSSGHSTANSHVDATVDVTTSPPSVYPHLQSATSSPMVVDPKFRIQENSSPILSNTRSTLEGTEPPDRLAQRFYSRSYSRST